MSRPPTKSEGVWGAAIRSPVSEGVWGTALRSPTRGLWGEEPLHLLWAGLQAKEYKDRDQTLMCGWAGGLILNSIQMVLAF